jgi:hypothetical protein
LHYASGRSGWKRKCGSMRLSGNRKNVLGIWNAKVQLHSKLCGTKRTTSLIALSAPYGMNVAGRNVYRIFKKILGENVDKETIQCYTVAMETE